MNKYSKASARRLATCEVDIQIIFRCILKDVDHSVLCGHRDSVEQNKAYNAGKSKLKYPQSKHNGYPSKAIDAAPYPIDWSDTKRFYEFGEFVKQRAEEMGYKLRWGGDWDGDGDYKDQTFNDLVHFELVT